MQITSNIQRLAPRATSQATTDVKGDAVKLLEENRVQDAIALLKGVSIEDTTGATQALLGKALFRAEDYGAAAKSLEAALALDPGNKELEGLRERAVNNDVSDIKVDRTFHKVDLGKLMGPPQPGEGFEVKHSTEEPTWGDKICSTLKSTRKLIRHAANMAIGGAFGVVAHWLGQEDKAEVWTQWSRTNAVKGMLMLANHRHNLSAHNRVSTYPQGELVGFQQRGQEAPEWALTNRTYDGTFNDLKNPKAGASGVRFPRNVALEATRQDTENLMTPNPRELSRVFGTREGGEPKRAAIANQLLSIWIQFMVHDWVDAGDPVTTGQLHEIPLAKDDPKRAELHMTHMLVGKTADDPTRRADEAGAPMTYINHATSWWDGSQIYGNDEATTRSLRSGVDGKLTMDENNNLPVDESGLEKTGVRRNMWVGLASLQTLFAREHNNIADMLKKNHPDWTDEQLFLKSRLGVAAIMAKIHTVEWTPAVLPNKVLNMAMNTNWYGAAEVLTKKAEDRKTINNWYNIPLEITGGIVGNDKKPHPTEYGLAMEFLDVYRLHSLLLDKYPTYKIGDQEPTGEFNLTESRMKGSHKIMEKEGLGNLLYSFGKEEACALTLNNYPTTLQDMSVPGFGFMDLMAVDLLRARERGVPRYNEMRRQLGLNEIKSFEDLTTDPTQLANLKREYNNDIEKIDLLVGTLAESVRPEGFGFGETLFQVFILNASLRLQADRFFTDDYNAETYTQELLDYIDTSTMKSVLLRNVPELAGSDLEKINNAFECWDADGIADPSRHPLEHAAKC